MLCVTIRIVTFFLSSEIRLLDARSGDRVERRRRLVEEHDSIRWASARAMHRRCCWPPERLDPTSFSRCLTCPTAPRRAAISTSRRSMFGWKCRAPAGRTQRSRRFDFGNGLGFWNTMLTRMRTSIGSTSSASRWCCPGTARSPRRAGVRVEVVHAVEAAQERRLAAAGRSDQRRHLALVTGIEIDSAPGTCVVERQVAALGLERRHRRIGDGGRDRTRSGAAEHRGVGRGLGTGFHRGHHLMFLRRR